MKTEGMYYVLLMIGDVKIGAAAQWHNGTTEKNIGF
jgi:hypothetical protein